MSKRPSVGLSVFVSHPGRPQEVILGRRKASTGAGKYATPGGHLERGETFGECARRETKEETGLTLMPVQVHAVVNVVFEEEKCHYIDIVTAAHIDMTHQDQPTNTEPHKCQGWEWFNWSQLPPTSELFRPTQVIVDSGYSPFDPSHRDTTFVESPLPENAAELTGAEGRLGVGVAVFVRHPGRPGHVLLGVRKGSTGTGTYAPPGGHLEFGETIEACARRELLEETGLVLKDVEVHTVVNAIWPENNYHYVVIVTSGEIDTSVKNEPENLEPEKCEGWQWFDWQNFPEKETLFRPLQIIRETKYSPFDASYNRIKVVESADYKQ